VRAIGRRSGFFFALTLVSLLLLIPCPAEFRWVAWLCSILAAFWGVLGALESLSSSPPRPQRRTQDTLTN
jgi:hypothetical protein